MRIRAIVIAEALAGVIRRGCPQSHRVSSRRQSSFLAVKNVVKFSVLNFLHVFSSTEICRKNPPHSSPSNIRKSIATNFWDRFRLRVIATISSLCRRSLFCVSVTFWQPFRHFFDAFGHLFAYPLLPPPFCGRVISNHQRSLVVMPPPPKRQKLVLIDPAFVVLGLASRDGWSFAPRRTPCRPIDPRPRYF